MSQADVFDYKYKSQLNKPEPRRVDRGSYQVIVRSRNRDSRRTNQVIKADRL